jgi:hypothetical protein
MDIYGVERARRKIDIAEIEIIKKILHEGLLKKIFKPMDIELSAVIIFHAIKGLEVPYIRQNLTSAFEKNKTKIVDYIFSGINRRNTSC